MARVTNGKSGLTMDEWWSAMRWQIAEKTGWALEYIDALSWGDVVEYMQVSDANTKWAEHQERARQRTASMSGRRR